MSKHDTKHRVAIRLQFGIRGGNYEFCVNEWLKQLKTTGIVELHDWEELFLEKTG